MEEDFDNNPDQGTVGEEYSETDTLNALEDLEDTDEGEQPQGTTEDHQQAKAEGEEPEADGNEEDNPSEDTDDQQDDENQDDSEQESKDTYVVKIDGVEEQITLDELKNGYSRQADYTRKSQEFAQEKTAFVERANHERAAVGHIFQKIEEIALGTEPNWSELAAGDPSIFLQAKEGWQQRVQAFEQIKQGLGQQNQQYQQQQAQTQKQAAEAMRQKLPELFPEWDTSEKMVAGQTAIINYAASQGITQQEINGIRNPVGLKILDKARAYDDLMSKKAAVTNKVRTAPKSLKPGASKGGTNNRSAQRNAMNTLRKNPGSEAAALAALDFLDD